MKNIISFEQFVNESKKPGPKEYYSGLSKSTADKRAAQIKKQTPMEDDDPEAYKKLPGDSKKTKPSKYTKKFAQMFNEMENLDEGEASPIRNSAVETALKNNVTTLGAQRHFDRVRQGVHTLQNLLAGLFFKNDLFCCHD